MNIIDFLISNHYSRRNQLYKLFPEKFVCAYRKIAMIVLSLIMFFMLYPFPNQKYYEFGINGKVEKMERVYKDWHLKIGTNWYVVNQRGMQYVQPGHIIVKKPFSWVFTVSDSLGNIVYQDSVRSLTFRLKDKV